MRRIIWCGLRKRPIRMMRRRAGKKVFGSLSTRRVTSRGWAITINRSVRGSDDDRKKFSGNRRGDAAIVARQDRSVHRGADGGADLGQGGGERECRGKSGAAFGRECAAVDHFRAGRSAGYSGAGQGIRDGGRDGDGGVEWAAAS